MHKANNLIRKHTSLIKYLITGTSAFIADYLILTALYYGLSFNLSTSTTMGFLVGFVISFVSNRKWVFGSKGSERKTTIQLVEYACLVVVNYIFTVTTINILKNAGLEPSISKVLIMGAITIWNYLIFKHIIFRPDKKDD